MASVHSDSSVPADPSCLYCLTDLAPGDHAHDLPVDVREVQLTVEAVARGEGPTALSR